MPQRSSRRNLVAAALGAVAFPSGAAATGASAFAYPIREPAGVPGGGLWIEVGYACENLADFPGWPRSAVRRTDFRGASIRQTVSTRSPY